MSKEREFDVVIWGSSGFTGSLVSEYIFKNYSKSKNLKWAIAGRNSNKLKQIRNKVADDSVSIL